MRKNKRDEIMKIAIYGSPKDFDYLDKQIIELKRNHIVTTHITPDYLNEAMNWADIILVCEAYNLDHNIINKVNGSWGKKPKTEILYLFEPLEDLVNKLVESAESSSKEK